MVYSLELAPKEFVSAHHAGREFHTKLESLATTTPARNAGRRWLEGRLEVCFAKGAMVKDSRWIEMN